MSRWAEAFAALSGGSDTVDTMRHSGAPIPTVSQSVKSVTAASAPLVLDHLKIPPVPSSTVERAAPPWSEIEEERAAIVEFAGGIPRAWAEGFARLDPDRPPGDVPPWRWLQFLDDIGRFLDGGFARQAAALGWGPFELFGVDRDRPFARIDQAGLIWQLNGDRLVALTAEAAVIEARSGARQTYRRKPRELDRMRAWELLSR